MHVSDLTPTTLAVCVALLVLAALCLITAFRIVDDRERDVASKRTLPFRSLETLGATEVFDEHEKTGPMRMPRPRLPSDPPEAA
jgi:hypothetical protein